MCTRRWIWKRGKAEAALIALDPRTGEILAFVGGRSYNQSQYDRAILSRRQPGSVFKPFVYLTAFEQAAKTGRTDVTPASITNDEQETFEFDDQVWTPENYEHEYDGPITFRRALAHSRNLGTIHVAQAAGYDNVAALWKKLGVGTAPKAYPSIALGVFEATPYEIATAYTLFPNGGTIRPLKHIQRITSGGKDVTKRDNSSPCEVARPDTTFLVTNMMRSVLNEGTAASARGMGFTLDAAGKTGTTNDLRDAWFVGFTPELLTHADRARRTREPALPGARGHYVHRHRRRDGQARRPALPENHHRGVPLGHRAAGALRPPSIGTRRDGLKAVPYVRPAPSARLKGSRPSGRASQNRLEAVPCGSSDPFRSPERLALHIINS